MVAYSFKKRFIGPIEEGKKRQTIRGKGKRHHAKAGSQLQLYYAMRTKQCRKIVDDVPCVEVAEVIIEFEKGEIVDIQENGQSVDCLDAFAQSDGFEDVSDMTTFWNENHVESVGYTGRSYPLVLIKW